MDSTEVAEEVVRKVDDGEETEEKRRGALIHVLSAGADKWGRKEAVRVKREVTNEVAAFSKNESAEVRAVHSKTLARKRWLKEQANEEMQDIQATLTESLKQADVECEESVSEIRGRYRGRYEEAEEVLHSKLKEVEKMVSSFIAGLPDLTNEQLLAVGCGDVPKLRPDG